MRLSAASMARVELRVLLLLQILGLALLTSAQYESMDYDYGSADITTDPTLVDMENDDDDNAIDEEDITFPFDHTKVDICETYPEGEETLNETINWPNKFPKITEEGKE